MKIPKKIRICGLDYKVVINNNLNNKEGLAGEHKGRELIMTLQGKPFHQQKIEQTFIHEILHSIDYNYNNDELTEKQIGMLANGIYQVLADNNLLK